MRISFIFVTLALIQSFGTMAVQSEKAYTTCEVLQLLEQNEEWWEISSMLGLNSSEGNSTLADGSVAFQLSMCQVYYCKEKCRLFCPCRTRVVRVQRVIDGYEVNKVGISG